MGIQRFIDTYFNFLVIFAVFRFIKHIRRAKNNAIQQITVDNTGIHYLKLDGKKESILYAELSRSPSSYNKDVFTKKTGDRYPITVLKVFHKNIEKRIAFRIQIFPIPASPEIIAD